MTLKEYIKHLNNIIKENPQAGDFLVIYACDDEGNSFHKTNFPPAIMAVKDTETLYDLQLDRSAEPNVICIN